MPRKDIDLVSVFEQPFQNVVQGSRASVKVADAEYIVFRRLMRETSEKCGFKILEEISPGGDTASGTEDLLGRRGSVVIKPGDGIQIDVILHEGIGLKQFKQTEGFHKHKHLVFASW